MMNNALSQVTFLPTLPPLDTESASPQALRHRLGERVRMARYAANLTQQELAGQTYSKSYISAVERGKMLPSLASLRLLAEQLGVSLA